jgi:uncharacterized membrane protein
MWPFSKKKEFFSKEENETIVQAIRDAERQTSGEIRLFIENRCRFIDPLDRAKEIFARLGMEQTAQRNGVLFYIALKDRQLAIFADRGINNAVGEQYWKNIVQHILALFNNENYVTGIKECVLEIGEALKNHFPYNGETDKNELPDDIIFGK